jgi:DUF4097 and DUF4098 domain-containing protein YvlB
MIRLLTFALALSPLAQAQDMHRVTEDFKYSYALNQNARLSVESFNGSIEVASWDRNEVEVAGTKYASSSDLLKEIKVDITNSPEFVTVRAHRPKGDDGWWGRGGAGVKMTIRVPRKVKLDRLASSNGAIRIENIEGDARVTTSNGAIRVANLKGRLEATTSNGKVEASGITGGAIAKSSNGAIEMSFSRLPDQGVEASTSNGAITIRLPEGVNADLRATTSNASVSSDYDVTTRGSIGKNRLEGRIGDGGALIRLSSSNGAIRIQKL